MKCSKGVFGAGQACQAMGSLYHDTCFTCAACSEYAGEGRVARGVQAKEGWAERASFVVHRGGRACPFKHQPKACQGKDLHRVPGLAWGGLW